MLLISDAKIEIDNNIFRSAYLKRIFSVVNIHSDPNFE